MQEYNYSRYAEFLKRQILEFIVRGRLYYLRFLLKIRLPYGFISRY